MSLTLTADSISIRRAVLNLQSLPAKVRNRHMKIAMSAAGGVVARQAIANLPKATGLLRKSIKVKAVVPDASYNVKHHGKPAYAIVGPTRRVVGPVIRGKDGKAKKLSDKKAFKYVMGGGKVETRSPSRYAHLIERGTKPHVIKSKTGKLLSSGSRVFGRSVNHPGTKGTSFLSRALFGTRSASLAAMQRKLTEGINTEAAKLAAKA